MTGASGFVGSQLKPYLETLQYDVTTVSLRDVDITNQYALSDAIHGNFDIVLHLAAWTKPGTFCKEFPGDQFLVNSTLNTAMLQWWKNNAPAAKFVTFGTSVSYSPDNPRLVEETYLDSNSDTNYIGYWAAKRHLLYGLQSLRKQYGMDYLYIVPSMIFGPGYDLQRHPWHFIYDIIFKLLHAKRSGTPAVLWGDGYQRRELIYITGFL